MFLTFYNIVYLIMMFFFVGIFLIKQEENSAIQSNNINYKKFTLKTYLSIGFVILIFFIAEYQNYNNRIDFINKNPEIMEQVKNYESK